MHKCSIKKATLIISYNVAQHIVDVDGMISLSYNEYSMKMCTNMSVYYVVITMK
jgi:hypothetical protein